MSESLEAKILKMLDFLDINDQEVMVDDIKYYISKIPYLFVFKGKELIKPEELPEAAFTKLVERCQEKIEIDTFIKRVGCNPFEAKR